MNLVKPAETEVAALSPDRSLFESQIATAKRFPRDESQVMLAISRDAMRDPEACFYAVPRGKQIVYGPSVRLAEMVLRRWGNLFCQARTVERTPTHVVVRADIWDMQSNAAVSEQVIVSLLDRDGKPMPQHLAVSLEQGAISKAIRNAVFRVVPRSWVNELVQQCRSAIRKTANPADIRAWLAQQRIPEKRVLTFFNVNDLSELSQQQLSDLRAIAASVARGEVDPQEAFAFDDAEAAEVAVSEPSDQSKAGEQNETGPVADYAGFRAAIEGLGLTESMILRYFDAQGVKASRIDELPLSALAEAAKDPKQFARAVLSWARGKKVKAENVELI